MPQQGNLLKLSFRMLLRDMRAGELTLIGLALIIAVASITSVGFLANRMHLALEQEARQLLGGDLLLVADHPWQSAFYEKEQHHSLKTATTISFASVVLANNTNQLSQIKAVSQHYPLRGNLRIATGLNTADTITQAIPTPGTAWVDERLASALNLKTGDKITLGATQLTMAAVLTYEPDRGINIFALAPRLLMNETDLEATKLIQVGSRVSYRLLIAGEDKAVRDYQQWAQAQLSKGARLEDLDNARPELRSALDRAQRFLGLAVMLAVILATVAMAITTRRFMQRHLDTCALLRCLGIKKSGLTQIFLYEFLFLGLLAGLVGCSLGYGVQWVLAKKLAQFIAIPLPQPNLFPLAQGVIVGLVLLVGFTVPSLLRLKEVPVLRVIRRELAPVQAGIIGSYASGFFVLALLMIWQARDIKLGVYVLGGFIAALGLYSLIAVFLLFLLKKIPHKAEFSWRYGLANLKRYAKTTIAQIVALSLGLTALLLLTIVRSDLITHWENTTPPDAPNRFIINIQPDQREGLAHFFAEHKLEAIQTYPMIRARLIALNGKPVSAADYESDRAKRLIEREFNLSWAEQLQTGNEIVAGQWFQPQDQGRPILSIEQGLAKTLNLKMGDELSFDIAGERLNARITNLRKVNWDSMRVNFFAVTPPGILEKYPTNFVTSFHLNKEQHNVINDLVRAFPNFTVIDVSLLLQQAKTMIDQVGQAVQFIFLFTLAAGLLVLYATLSATQDERFREAALLRALGARRQQLIKAHVAEYIVLGCISGLLAALGASAIQIVLATRVFDLDASFNFSLAWAGLLLGLLCISFTGWLSARRAIRQAPIVALRESG